MNTIQPIAFDNGTISIVARQHLRPRLRRQALDILPRMNAGDSRISRFGFLFATTKQERRGR